MAFMSFNAYISYHFELKQIQFQLTLKQQLYMFYPFSFFFIMLDKWEFPKGNLFRLEHF